MGEAALKLKPVSTEEYLRSEEYSPVKREYVDGWVCALAGVRDRHNRVAGNVYFRLRQAIGVGACRAYVSDIKLRIRTERGERFYYPDVMVTCDPKDTHDLYKVSPCLLVEVLSPSTEGSDRREKLFAYQTLPTLRDYLIVDPEARYVERYRRDEEDGWWYHEYRESGTLKLPYVGFELTLDDIYEGL